MVPPSLTNLLQQQSVLDTHGDKPTFYRLKNPEECHALEILLKQNPHIIVCDRIDSQLRDLVKLENPSVTLTEEQYANLVKEKLSDRPSDEYGVWVYYPWRAMVVHMLDEEEFVRVRTIRNAYKITFEEQAELRKKKIGIIGLSVGQSVALALAMERIGGELRIADFDKLELSNLNRIRTGVASIGLHKTTIVAREIADIDPFIKVKCFHAGIDPENIDAFFDDGGKLDLLVEECDSVEVKILARQHAKRRGIPVVMDTSDRGMLDIERYDEDPDYPMLHGLIDETISYDFLKSLKSSEEKLPYIIPILGVDSLSRRLKVSGLEVGSTITTWPQLGTDVMLGGAIAANSVRRILLGEKIISERKYFDHEDQDPTKNIQQIIDVSDGAMNRNLLESIYDRLELPDAFAVGKDIVQRIVEDANWASSPGNSQRWLWYYKNGNLLLFLDKEVERSFADNFSFGSLIGFGCALENLRLSALTESLSPKIVHLKRVNFSDPVVHVTFSNASNTEPEAVLLSKYIRLRTSNRKNVPYAQLNGIEVSEFLNVELPNHVRFNFVTDRDIISRIGKLICKADRMRLMNLYGHQDFFKNEIRWTKSECESTRDGLDLSLFDLTALDKIGLQLSKELETINVLNEIDGGKGFERISRYSFDSASAVGLIDIPDFSQEALIDGGMAAERIWLMATCLGLGFQPFTILQMLFSRLHMDDLSYLNDSERHKVIGLKSELEEILPVLKGRKSVFLFRITKADKPDSTSLRKPIDQKLVFA